MGSIVLKGGFARIFRMPVKSSSSFSEHEFLPYIARRDVIWEDFHPPDKRLLLELDVELLNWSFSTLVVRVVVVVFVEFPSVDVTHDVMVVVESGVLLDDKSSILRAASSGCHEHSSGLV